MKRLEKAQDRQSFRRVNPWALSALGAYLRTKTFGVLAFQHDTKVCKFNHALRFGALCGRL